MTLFFNIGRATVTHLIKKFVTDKGVTSYTPRVETMCGKIVDAPWINEETRRKQCKQCDEILKEILDSILEFKCNLCEVTVAGNTHWRRSEHYINSHDITIKSDKDKAESVKWFTIIFQKPLRGHELKIRWNADVGWTGSCKCGKGKFYGVHDKILCHKQFTQHIRESEVLPVGF